MIADVGTRFERPHPRSVAVSRRARRSPRLPGDVEERARELITMAAHDLRSPLASTRFRAHSIIQRWKAGELPRCDEWASVMMGISAAVDDAFCMIDDLLVMERLEQAGPRAPPSSIIDIQTVIDKAIEREKLALDQAGCQVIVLRHKRRGAIRGPWDRVYLLRVFGNLLRNAANHAAGEPIVITLAPRGDRLGVVVADRGPGFPEQGGRKRLVGDRSERSRAADEIHGLGLWIVRRAVERLHGRLRIHSCPGEGLTVDVELPYLQRC